MTGFAFAYAVMRVCGGQPRKNPGAPLAILIIFSRWGRHEPISMATCYRQFSIHTKRLMASTGDIQVGHLFDFDPDFWTSCYCCSIR